MLNFKKSEQKKPEKNDVKEGGEKNFFNQKVDKKIFSIIGKILIFILSIYIWYLSIPIFIMWYIWKKTKWNRKRKFFGTAMSIVLLFILTGIFFYMNRVPALNIIEPETNTTVQKNSIQIKGNFEPKNSKISINGIVLSAENGEFDYLAKLTQETNLFVIEVKNGGSKIEEEVVVKRIFTEAEKEEIERIKQEELAERERINQENQEKNLIDKKDKLEKEISSVSSFDNSNFRGNIDNLIMEVVLFKAWAIQIQEAKSDKNNEIVSLGQQLEDKVVQLQKKEFPLMRKEYEKLTSSILWEHDVDVKVSGQYNQIIELVGALFAANKNIKDTHLTIIEMLELLRFDRVNYKWYKYDSEYTYYDIDSVEDGVLVE